MIEYTTIKNNVIGFFCNCDQPFVNDRVEDLRQHSSLVGVSYLQPVKRCWRDQKQLQIFFIIVGDMILVWVQNIP